MNTLHTPSPSAAPLPLAGTLAPSPDLLLPLPAGPRWRSEELLAGTDEALIAHGDQVYRLRRTGTGKLILTK